MNRVGQTVLPGHGLVDEGSAHDEHGNRIWVSNNACDAFSGPGRALCKCGELSEELPTKAARRRWHNAHKEEVRSRQSDK